MAETGRGGLSPQDQAAFDRALQGVEQHFGSGGSATAVATPETPAAAGEVVPLAGQPKKPSLLKRILGRGGSPAAANGGTPTAEQQSPDIAEPADSPAPGAETLSPEQARLAGKIWNGLKTGFKSWVQNLNPADKDWAWRIGVGAGVAESLLTVNIPLGPANGLIKAGVNFAMGQALYGVSKGYFGAVEALHTRRMSGDERQARIAELRDSKRSFEGKLRNFMLGLSAGATYVSFGGIAAHLAPEIMKAVGAEMVLSNLSLPNMGVEAPAPGSISAIEAGGTLPASDVAPAVPVSAPTADLSGVHAAASAIHLPEAPGAGSITGTELGSLGLNMADGDISQPAHAAVSASAPTSAGGIFGVQMPHLGEAPTGGAISSTELQTLGMSGESTAAQPLNVTTTAPAAPGSVPAPAGSGGFLGINLPNMGVEAPAPGSISAIESAGTTIPGSEITAGTTATAPIVPASVTAPDLHLPGGVPAAGSITGTELQTMGLGSESTLAQPLNVTTTAPAAPGSVPAPAGSGGFLGINLPNMGVEAPAPGSISAIEAGGTLPASDVAPAAPAPAVGPEVAERAARIAEVQAPLNADPLVVQQAQEHAARIAEPQAPLDANPNISTVSAPATPSIGLDVNTSAGAVSAPSADVASTALSESQTKAVKAMETLFASADNPAAQAVGAHFDQTNEIADAAIAKAGINPATLSASQYEAVRSAVQDQFELTANEAFTKAAAKVADPDKIQEAVKEGKEVFGAYLQNDSGQERLTGLARKVLDAQLGVNNQIAENINQVLTPDIVSSADVQSSVGQTLVDHGYDLTSWGADKAQLFGAEIAVNYDALSNYWGEVAKAGNLPDGLHFPMSPGEINSLVEAAQNGDAEALQKLKDALHWFPADKKFKILNKAGIAAVLKAIK